MGTMLQAREGNPSEPVSYYRARYYDPSTGRFLLEDPIGFTAGTNKYKFVLNDPLGYRDPTGLWPWNNYYKTKTLEAQAEADLAIYSMTSPFATDPFTIAKCRPAVYLVEINQLSYMNLEIDHVLAGASAVGLLVKYPELIGTPEGQMGEMISKLRDANNRKIDTLLGRAAAQPTCGCSK